MQLTRKQRQYSIVGLSTLAVVGAIAILAKTFPHLNPFASKENSSENGEDGQLLGQDKEQEKKENAEADEIDDDEVEVEESAVLAWFCFSPLSLLKKISTRFYYPLF